MSDSPSPDTPTPPSGLRMPTDHSQHDDNVEQLRGRLSRIALCAVGVVALLAVAGTAAIIINSSWAEFAALSVVTGCVGVVLVAGIRGTVAVRDFRPVQIFEQSPSSSSSSGVSAATHSGKTPSPYRRTDGSSWTEPSAPPSPQPRTEPPEDDFTRRREVFGKLAHRLQSLVNRGIARIDSLEREVEDPDLLKGLYEVDHLITRVRRQAENLAVLGGEAPQRRSEEPISVYAVLRSAVAEVEHYKQISIVPTEDVRIHGHVIAEVIHLLAELLENATNFTAPHSPNVVLRAEKVTAGYAIEVQDRGLGMSSADLHRINRLLDGSASINLPDLLEDGRIGLAVVKELADRHDARVQLQTNIFGGIDAVIVLPHTLMSEPDTDVTELLHRSPDDGSRTAVASTAQYDDQEPHVPTPQPRPTADPPWYSEPDPDPTEFTAVFEEFHSGTLTPEPSSGDLNAELEYNNATLTPSVPELPTRSPGDNVSYPYSSPQLASVEDAGDASDPMFTSVSQARHAMEAPDPIGTEPDSQSERPPLPQRRGESHLHPNLREAPRPTMPIPGHNANLMATVRQGLDRGYDVDAITEGNWPEHIQSTEDSRDDS